MVHVNFLTSTIVIHNNNIIAGPTDKDDDCQGGISRGDWEAEHDAEERPDAGDGGEQERGDGGDGDWQIEGGSEAVLSVSWTNWNKYCNSAARDSFSTPLILHILILFCIKSTYNQEQNSFSG